MMNIKNKLWIKILVSSIISIVLLICLVNFVVDPYNLYKMDFYPNKPKQTGQMRLIKLLEIKEKIPVSIVLGTSRADMAIDPTHQYFQQPSYNLSNSGATVYEAKYYVKEAVKLGVKNILLVADWRMFNDTMKKTDDFESYFDNLNIYKYLLSYKSFKDSIYTIKNQNLNNFYFSNGLMNDSHMWNSISSQGGHFSVMKKDEKSYYKSYSSNNKYRDTKKNSFIDFIKILRICYENKINLEIIFGPSHIRQWEAFSYYHDINIWYKWKKDVVLAVNQVAKEKNKNPFRVFDFSVYHDFTAEKVPTDPQVTMKYHWESSHYKKELANIVLDRLLGISPYKDFGVELNIQNIDNYIQKLKDDRVNFIDTKAYRHEIFGQ